MKNKQKGFLGLSVLIILGIALIGGGGYLYTQQKKNVDVQTNQEVNATTSISVDDKGAMEEKVNEAQKTIVEPVKLNVVDATKKVLPKIVEETIQTKEPAPQAPGTVTYKDEKFGFELTYSSNYKIDIDKHYYPDKFGGYVKFSKNKEIASFYNNISVNINDLNDKTNYYTNCNIYTKNTDVTKENINGLVFKKGYTDEYSSGFDTSAFSYCTVNDDKVYVISIGVIGGPVDPELDKVAHTFKLVR